MGRQLQHKQDPTQTPHPHPEISDHGAEPRQSCANVAAFVEQQVNSQTLIPEFDLISVNAQVIRADLEVAKKHILTEVDAYEQGNKVEAALKAKSARRRR